MKQLSLAFLNTRGWNEGKWRTIIEENSECDVIGIAETGWHDSVHWREGGWIGIGKGREVGQKKGGGVGILIREKEGRRLVEVREDEAVRNLGYNKGDIMTAKIKEGGDIWWITI